MKKSYKEWLALFSTEPGFKIVVAEEPLLRIFLDLTDERLKGTAGDIGEYREDLLEYSPDSTDVELLSEVKKEATGWEKTDPLYILMMALYEEGVESVFLPDKEEKMGEELYWIIDLSKVLK